MTNSWGTNDRREIDPILKDYLVNDSGYSEINAVSQKVYLALSRVDFNQPKKTPYIQESLKTQINEALKDMIKKNEITITEIRMSESSGTMSIEII